MKKIMIFILMILLLASMTLAMTCSTETECYIGNRLLYDNGSMHEGANCSIISYYPNGTLFYDNTTLNNSNYYYVVLNTTVVGHYITSIECNETASDISFDVISRVTLNYYTSTNNSPTGMVVARTAPVVQGGGILPSGLLWGVDLFFEKTSYYLLHYNNESRVEYALDKLGERQLEAIACIRNSDNDCLDKVSSDSATPMLFTESYSKVNNEFVLGDVKDRLDEMRVEYKKYAPNAWSDTFDVIYDIVI